MLFTITRALIDFIPNPFNPTTTMRFDLPIEGQYKHLSMPRILKKNEKIAQNLYETSDSKEGKYYVKYAIPLKEIMVTIC